MPWKAADASQHKKGLTSTQQKAWAEIANSALKEYGDEASAIRVANAKAPKAHHATHYREEQKEASKSKMLQRVPKVSASGRRNPKALPTGKVVVGRGEKSIRAAEKGRGKQGK